MFYIIDERSKLWGCIQNCQVTYLIGWVVTHSLDPTILYIIFDIIDKLQINSENSKKVRAQAIIKDWSEQHEYELAKYTIEILMSFKASRREIYSFLRMYVQYYAQMRTSVTTMTSWKSKMESLESAAVQLRMSNNSPLHMQ